MAEGENMLAKTNRQKLNPADDADHVNVVGTIVDLVMITAVSIVLNFLPNKVGIIKSLTDPSSFSPLLAPEFQDHMPMLNIYWGLAASLCIANLVLRRWNIVTRSAELGLNFLALVILVQMVLGGPLAVSAGLTLVFKLGLGIAVIPTCVAVIKGVYQLISKYTITVEAKA
jgi:hypothetical protein